MREESEFFGKLVETRGGLLLEFLHHGVSGFRKFDIHVGARGVEILLQFVVERLQLVGVESGIKVLAVAQCALQVVGGGQSAGRRIGT